MPPLIQMVDLKRCRRPDLSKSDPSDTNLVPTRIDPTGPALPCTQCIEEAMTSKITVLVVEDEALLRMNTVEELTDQGLEVVEAANAREAIAIFQSGKRFECLFTDVDMPGDVDGLELATMVKDAWPPIEVIVTSGHRNVTHDDLPPRGVFVGKPYSLDTVGDLIRRLTAAGEQFHA
ncbi:response regulator [Devosia sp. 1635]|uniref:response regulator n=2 Tax=unclassified Devosia TaxID=196773 RepID=UPI0020BEA598|nr:response regulator [Devosia sp. 1635]